MLVPVAPHPPTLGLVSLFYFNHSTRRIVSLDFELKKFFQFPESRSRPGKSKL